MKRHTAIVTVAGPDGAGKSTVALMMVEQLLKEPVIHLHHRPGMLPRSRAAQQPVTEPHARPPYSRVKSIAKVLFLWVDYHLGWWFRLQPVKRAGGSAIIERGWADLEIDPLRYRLRGTQRLSAMLASLLPKPDLVVILHADTATLLGRVTELTEGELTRQLEAWRTWASGRPGVIEVDASQPLDDIIGVVSMELDRISARIDS